MMPLWIAADWGTSNLRLWGIGERGEVLFALFSDKGMSRISPADYPRILAEMLDGRLPDSEMPVPVVICGMAGARQGWLEAPYLALPAKLEAFGREAVRPEIADRQLVPYILPGLSANERGHEDVMRGEETQILGLLALRPGYEGAICLPGTHSKWAMVENGRITRFRTAMTGELFELLSTQSVLRHALAGEDSGAFFEDGISEGLARGLASPEQLTALLFRTRAAALLSDRPADWCRGYLSGLLVGAEVAGFRLWRRDQPVVIIGSDRLCRLYASGLARDGGKGIPITAEKAVLAGLDAARRHLPPM
jgi:2-dehydro-3-deoxygalactonokinase